MILFKITGNIFALLISATILVAAGIFKDQIVQVEPAVRSLRGQFLPAASSPKVVEDRRELSKVSSCSRSSDEDSCNSTQDESGNPCRWCTDHLLRRVCVSDDSYGYKFAPCNQWICYATDDPEKSDLTLCQRVGV